MKRLISTLLAAVTVLSAVSLVACGKKHVINADVDPDPFDPAVADGDVVYVPVTDRNGENVTDAEGETVTEAVTALHPTTEAASSPASQERTTKTAEASRTTEAATKKDTAAVVEPTTATTALKADEYVLTLSADKTEVKAGDTLTLTYRLKNCKNVACASFTVEAGKDVAVTDYKSKRYYNEDGSGFDIYSNSTDEGVLFSGMITTTCDFDDADLFTVTYRVGDQVRKGDKLTFRVVPTTFLVGDDSSGKHTKDYCAMLEKASVTVTVK